MNATDLDIIHVDLISAAKSGNLCRLQKALQDGADIHFNNDEALTSTAICGNFNLLQYICENYMDIFKDRNAIISALTCSAVANDVTMIDYLVSYAKIKPQEHSEGLRLASIYGLLESVQYFIGNGGNVHYALAFSTAKPNVTKWCLEYIQTHELYKKMNDDLSDSKTQTIHKIKV